MQCYLENVQDSVGNIAADEGLAWPRVAPTHSNLNRRTAREITRMCCKQTTDTLLNGILQPTLYVWGPALAVACPNGTVFYKRVFYKRVFYKRDLVSGYWQVPKRTKYVVKNAFTSVWNSRDLKVMPYGVAEHDSCDD
jgi:hypothetical protein